MTCLKFDQNADNRVEENGKANCNKIGHKCALVHARQTEEVAHVAGHWIIGGICRGSLHLLVDVQICANHKGKMGKQVDWLIEVTVTGNFVKSRKMSKFTRLARKLPTVGQNSTRPSC